MSNLASEVRVMRGEGSCVACRRQAEKAGTTLAPHVARFIIKRVTDDGRVNIFTTACERSLADELLRIERVVFPVTGAGAGLEVE